MKRASELESNFSPSRSSPGKSPKDTEVDKSAVCCPILSASSPKRAKTEGSESGVDDFIINSTTSINNSSTNIKELKDNNGEDNSAINNSDNNKAVMHPAELIIGSLSDFLDAALSKLSKIGVDMEVSKGYEIDHVCYRCESIEEYLKVCKDLASIGECIMEGMIAGRPISIILLNSPIKYRHFSIPCLEIPCPKKGSFYKSGLEHLEVAISTAPCSTDEMIAEFRDNSKLIEFAKQFPDVNFDTKSLKKDINADICIDVDENIRVKFHNRPIRDVCLYEKTCGSAVAVPKDYFTENK
jgi:predicted metalloenzyme YecM